MVESIIGLFKTESIWSRGPWKNIDEVEYATLEWVDRYNNKRLLGPIGDIPPVVSLISSESELLANSRKYSGTPP